MGTYHDGHLVAAAIRVLETREKHPPTADEIAALIHWHAEQVGVTLRILEELDAIFAVTTPFDTRYELRDHLKIEEIDQDEQGPGFADELAEFQEKSEKEKEKLERLFKTGEADEARRKKLESLDDDFRNFKEGKPLNPFGDD